MTQTRVDLVHAALKNLGVLPAGETPSAEEFSLVDSKVDPMVAALRTRNIVLIPDVDAIDDNYFIPLAYWLANSARPEFGELGTTGAQEIQALKEQAERDLRNMQRGKVAS